MAIPHGYSIQAAEARHIPFLNAIELAAAAIFPPGVIPEAMRSDRMPVAVLAQAVDEGRLWVALKDEGQPVGYVLLRIIDGSALLAQIDVHPSHARKGLGAELVRQVIASAKAQGFADLYLTTFTHVRWNAPFYAGLGFSIIPEPEQPPFIRDTLTEEKRRGLEHRAAMRLELSAPSPVTGRL